MCFHNITDDKVRRALNRELMFIIAGISAVYTFISWVTNPVNDLKTDVAVIKSNLYKIESNHLTHIQADIKNINCEIKEMRDVQMKHEAISAANGAKLDVLIKLIK